MPEQMTATDSRMVALRPDDMGTIRANRPFLAPDLGIEPWAVPSGSHP